MPKQLKRDEKHYQIYALVDPRDDNIRYVGLSADTNYRFYQHMQRYGGKLEIAWLKELHRSDLSPILKILETVSPNDYSTACERERYWIQSLQNEGYSLVNVFGTNKRTYPRIRANKKLPNTQSSEATVVALPIPLVASRNRTANNNRRLVATEKHDFEKLLENMPATQAELARLSGINERTIIRMKNGEIVLRSTANKVLRGLSQIYGQSLTLDNVTGINVSDR